VSKTIGFRPDDKLKAAIDAAQAVSGLATSDLLAQAVKAGLSYVVVQAALKREQARKRYAAAMEKLNEKEAA
jgi:hypothetical protein